MSEEKELEHAINRLKRDGEITFDDLEARVADGRRTDLCEVVVVREREQLCRLWAEGFRPS